MKVIYNGNQIEIEDGITLEQFVVQQGGLGGAFLVNGVSVDSGTVLTSYNVIESDSSGTVVSAAASTSRVDVDLSDFTGQSGLITTDNNLSAIRARYDNDVSISVIRDNQPIDTQELQTGDRVMVMPSGGVKGA
jgi:hypothetical protein